MLNKDTRNKLSAMTISLHWIVALSIIVLLAMGIYMEENHAYALYPWHKSFGMLVLLFVVARILWRIYNNWPVPVSNYAKVEKITAKVVHYVLIIATLMMPVSGMLMSGLGGHGLQFFGLELMAANPDPANPGKVVAINGFIAGAAHELHEILGNVIIAALALHIIGALKHHFIDKDGTLKRMFGRKV